MKNQDVWVATVKANSSKVDENIKYLSTTAKSAKSKKPKLIKPKKLHSAKVNFSGTEFLTPGAKKAFIHSCKIFTKAPILSYFDLKRYIQIKTNVLVYAIDKVLNQMNSDQLFF